MTPSNYLLLVQRCLTELFGVDTQDAQKMMKELREHSHIEGMQSVDDLDKPFYIACDLARVVEVADEVVDAYIEMEKPYL